MNSPKFRLPANVTFKQDEDTGEWTFRGVASSTKVDNEGERITEEALSGFVRQLGEVPLTATFTGHQEATGSPMAEIGLVTGGDIADEKLVISGHLFKTHPYAEFINERLSSDSPPDWELSIGGSIPKGAKSYSMQENVTEIDAVKLNHILLCRGGTAINDDTSFGRMVFKAAEEIDADIVDIPEEYWYTGSDEDATKVDDHDIDIDVSKVQDVSDRDWSSVDKTKLPRSCFLYKGEADKKSTWAFPVYEGAGELNDEGMYTQKGPLNRSACHSAASYLSKTSQKIRSVVRPKLRRLYTEVLDVATEDLPDNLQKQEAQNMGDETPDIPEEAAKDAEDAERGLSVLQKIGRALAGGAVGDEEASETDKSDGATEGPEANFVTKDELDDAMDGIADKLDRVEELVSAKVEENEENDDTPDDATDETEKTETDSDDSPEDEEDDDEMDERLGRIEEMVASNKSVVEQLAEEGAISIQPSTDENSGEGGDADVGKASDEDVPEDAIFSDVTKSIQDLPA